MIHEEFSTVSSFPRIHESINNLPPFDLAFGNLSIQLHDHIWITCSLKSIQKVATVGKKQKKKKGIYECGKDNYYDRKPAQSTKCIKCSPVGDKNG